MLIIQVLADEQKKLHPDCWKRKRSLSSANQNTPSSHSSNPSTIHHVPPSPSGPLGHSMPPTPTRLSHPLSFLTGDRFAHPGLGSIGISASNPASLGLVSVPPLEHNPRQNELYLREVLMRRLIKRQKLRATEKKKQMLFFALKAIKNFGVTETNLINENETLLIMRTGTLSL